MPMKDKAALVLALSMFSGASIAAGAGAGAAQGDALEGQSPIAQQEGTGVMGGDTGDAAEAPGASPPPGADGMREDEVAQWASEEDKERFEQLDVSGTGYLTREEAQADSELAERFDELDTDQTGVISEAEFAQFLETQNGEGTAVTPGNGAGGSGGLTDDGGAASPGSEPGTPEGGGIGGQ